MFESFFQDVRVGLRVLFKEKSFCFLAVLVLALGIGGATTQFTVVNATVLRGFSFPHPEQLMSVGLIDPQGSAQNNNFGLGNIPTAQDYEDLRAAQQSFAQMAGYLSGSTINVTYKNNPQRYTGAYITEDLFKIIGVSPIMGRDFTAHDRERPAPFEGNDRAATASAGLGNAWRGHSRLADRVRERDEYAIWSRRLAGKGTGDSRCAWRHPLENRAPDAD